MILIISKRDIGNINECSLELNDKFEEHLGVNRKDYDLIAYFDKDHSTILENIHMSKIVDEARKNIILKSIEGMTVLEAKDMLTEILNNFDSISTVDCLYHY